MLLISYNLADSWWRGLMYIAYWNLCMVIGCISKWVRLRVSDPLVFKVQKVENLSAIQNHLNCPLFSPEANLKLYLFEIGTVKWTLKHHSKCLSNFGWRNTMYMASLRHFVLCVRLCSFRKADEEAELFPSWSDSHRSSEARANTNVLMVPNVFPTLDRERNSFADW